MAFRLTITDTRHPDFSYQCGFIQGQIAIGRAQICDLCLPDLTVCPMHAEIRLQGHHYTLVDLSSQNGTLVASRKLIPHRPTKLASNDEITIAHYRIVFESGTHPSAIGKQAIGQCAHDLLHRRLAHQGHLAHVTPTLLGLSGPGRGARFTFVQTGDSATMGRTRHNAIPLDDPEVTSAHAAVQWQDDGQLMVRDLGSRNGTWCNGERCDSFALVPGLTFAVGQTTFGLEDPVAAALQDIQLAPHEATVPFVPDIPTPAPHATDANDAETAPASPATPDDDHVAPPPAAPSPVTTLPTGVTEPSLDVPGTRDSQAPQHDNDAAPKEESDIGLILVGTAIIVMLVLFLIWFLG